MSEHLSVIWPTNESWPSGLFDCSAGLIKLSANVCCSNSIDLPSGSVKWHKYPMSRNCDGVDTLVPLMLILVRAKSTSGKVSPIFQYTFFFLLLLSWSFSFILKSLISFNLAPWPGNWQRNCSSCSSIEKPRTLPYQAANSFTFSDLKVTPNSFPGMFTTLCTPWLIWNEKKRP